MRTYLAALLLALLVTWLSAGTDAMLIAAMIGSAPLGVVIGRLLRR